MSPWLLVGIYVLVLGTFVGLELIGKLPPTLHVPLIAAMSAAAGVVLILALRLPGGGSALSSALSGGVLALGILAAVGGYLSTVKLLPERRKEQR